MRPGRISSTFARVCSVSVTTPACEPVSEIAVWPRSWIAIAASAHEIRSPTESSMSSSRGSGAGEISWARSTSSSVEPPIAESTPTTSLPASRAATSRRATAFSRSGPSTDVPPNFWTTRPTGTDATRLYTRSLGGVPERSNGAVLKTVGRASVPWVQIPPPPLSLATCPSAQALRGRHRLAGASRMRDCPLEREVGDCLPSVGAARPVIAAFELVVLGDRVALVVLGVRLVHRRGHDVVLAAGDEEERRAVRVLVVDPRLLMTGLEVGDEAVGPDPVARGGDVVALVDLPRLLFAECVRERVVELVGREADRLVPVRGSLESGEQRLDL